MFSAGKFCLLLQVVAMVLEVPTAPFKREETIAGAYQVAEFEVSTKEAYLSLSMRHNKRD
jgi:hypothetical protein